MAAALRRHRRVQYKRLPKPPVRVHSRSGARPLTRSAHAREAKGGSRLRTAPQLGELTAELDAHAQIDGQRVYAAVMVILTNSMYTTSSGATWRADAFLTRLRRGCPPPRISWGED